MMDNMTDRPTPEQVITRVVNDRNYAKGIIWELEQHGYKIVHPGDVPATLQPWDGLFGSTADEAYEFGCRNMRAHILGGDE